MMGINIVSIILMLFLSAIWYMYSLEDGKINRGVVQLTDKNRTATYKPTSDKLNSITLKHTITQTTTNTKTIKKFDDVFKEPKEDIAEEIASKRNIQALDEKVQNVISQGDMIIKKNNLVVKTDIQDIDTQDKELDSLISQIEEVRDDN
jgi:hypothetical protein